MRDREACTIHCVKSYLYMRSIRFLSYWLVTGAVYADTTMFENIGKGNGLATGVCSVRKKPC
jgi:hypothetical protein